MDVSTDWTTEGLPELPIHYDLERISIHSLRHSFANNVTRKDCSVPRKFRPFKLLIPASHQQVSYIPILDNSFFGILYV